LKTRVGALDLGVTSKNLFPKIPTIRFVPTSGETRKCSCSGSLKVWETHTKVVATLEIGEFTAHETIFYCDSCPQRHHSEELGNLVPHGCKFGFDVMVYIGKALFLHHRTIIEVESELENKNIKISSSEVSYLAQKFIVYLAIAHKESSLKIKDFMDKKGGYILHLDGMCEGGSPHLISVLDEISDFVLGNLKIPTENALQIIPLLKEVKKTFGNPQAVVHDMGRAMLSSVADVFPGVRDYICHFHFLRDIGKDLFSKEYTVIRKRLKKHGISTKLRYRLRQFEKDEQHRLNFDQITKMIETNQFPNDTDVSILKSSCYVLIIWALDGKNQGNGFGFPFDRPHLVFYERLNIVNETLKKMKQSFINTNSKDLKPVLQLSSDLQSITKDSCCKKILPPLLQKIDVFDKLRKAMRITLPDSDKGLNDNGQDTDIKTIKQGVKNFRKWLINKRIYDENEECKKMIEQIDKYWEKLFADPISVETPAGTVIIQPQRTNNLLEHFFRDYRKDYRRRSGNNNMTKMLQTILADTPLVKNLENPEYMKILLNGKTNLEERFAEIDAKIVRYEVKKAKQKNEKIPIKIKKMIKSEKNMKLFLNLF